MINMSKELLKKNLRYIRDFIFDRLPEVKEIYDAAADYYGEGHVDIQFSQYNVNTPLVSYIDLPELYEGCTDERKTVYKTLIKYTNTEKTLIGGLSEIDNIETVRYIAECLILRERTLDFYIYWPVVTIENDYDQVYKIHDLYAYFRVTKTGNLDMMFRLNRSTYTEAEWYGSYMHSHILGPSSDSREFMTPCLGEGPVKDTQLSLVAGFDSSLWRLFMLELDKYVHVESDSGGPYHRFSQITDGNIYAITKFEQDSLSFAGLFKDPIFKAFLPKLIDNWPFKFCWVGDHYAIAAHISKVIWTISNMYIEYMNNLYTTGIIDKKKYTGFMDSYTQRTIYNKGYLCYLIESLERQSCENLEGNKIFTFKGDDVRLHFTEDVNTNNYIITLNSTIISRIVDILFRVYNYLNLTTIKGYESKVNKDVRFI